VANAAAAAAGGAIAVAIGVVILTAVFTAGLWARKYAFIVIFEGLLALTLIFASLALIFASTLLQAVVTGGLVLLCAPVFWLLVRVMARLQVPPQ